MLRGMTLLCALSKVRDDMVTCFRQWLTLTLDKVPVTACLLGLTLGRWAYAALANRNPSLIALNVGRWA